MNQDDENEDSSEELEMIEYELEGTNELEKSIVKREKEINKNQGDL